MPSWQSSALSGSGCSRRATADLSAAAAFYSGGQNTDIAVYEGGWQSVEGTSASSPMMAGILTRLGLAETISQNLGWVYTNASAFNDLGSSAYPVDSSGSNTDSASPSSCGKLCTAGEGLGLDRAASARPTAPGWPRRRGSHDDDGRGAPRPAPTEAQRPLELDVRDVHRASRDGRRRFHDSGPAGPGTLGAGCAAKTDCLSLICAEPSAGAPAVCTEPCVNTDAGSTCLFGFTCNYGYCFAETHRPFSPRYRTQGRTAASTAGARPGGARCRRRVTPDVGQLGWLALGIVAVVARRKRQPKG